jgi:hypothetical protein
VELAACRLCRAAGVRALQALCCCGEPRDAAPTSAARRVLGVLLRAPRWRPTDGLESFSHAPDARRVRAMARLPIALLLSSAVVLLARGAQSSLESPACAANSVDFCWTGVAPRGNLTAAVSQRRLNLLASTFFMPSVDGAVCSCWNGTEWDGNNAGDINFGFTDQGTMQAPSSHFFSSLSCSSRGCNCGVAGCPISPITAGICPSTGSAGPLSCRVGLVGSSQSVDESGVAYGPVVAFQPSSPGNLVSFIFPAGSVCLAKTISGDNNLPFTIYKNGTVAQCLADYADYSDYGGTRNIISFCTTDNCGVPAGAGTGPVCPVISSATSCTIGMTGPSGAVAAINAVFADPEGFGQFGAFTSSTAAPSVRAVPFGSACVAFTQPCAPLVGSAEFPGVNSTTCPASQSVSVFIAALTDTVRVPGEQWYDLPPPHCNNALFSFGTLSNASGIMACGTTNCNAPTTSTYLAASAVLGGYTVTTFGTLQAGQFAYGMATALSVPYSAVTVTSVTATTTRRSLLAAGVSVGFSVQTTLAAASTMGAALAAPLNASLLKSAGLSAVTSVAVTPTPTASGTAAPVAILASALPNTGTYVAPNSAATQPASMLVAAVAVAVAAMLA